MARVSRQYDLALAIRDTLLADSDLDGRNWKVQKKGRHRNKPWEPGAYVIIGDPSEPPTENDRDIIAYSFSIVICDPTDADLTTGMETHLADIERVEDIFRNKSGTRVPGTLLDASVPTTPTSDKTMTVIRCDARPQKRFDSAAFDAGYDLSFCTVTIDIRIPRRNVASL